MQALSWFPEKPTCPLLFRGRQLRDRCRNTAFSHVSLRWLGSRWPALRRARRGSVTQAWGSGGKSPRLVRSPSARVRPVTAGGRAQVTQRAHERYPCEGTPWLRGAQTAMLASLIQCSGSKGPADTD